MITVIVEAMIMAMGSSGRAKTFWGKVRLMFRRTTRCCSSLLGPPMRKQVKPWFQFKRGGTDGVASLRG